MITSSFTEWVKARQLNEVYAQGKGVGGTFGNLSQKKDDIILYDVHGLSRMADRLPEGEGFPELSLKWYTDKIGAIVGANPVKRKVMATKPATLSYQRFKKSRGKTLNIPLKSLWNITELFPDSELSPEPDPEADPLQPQPPKEKKSVWLAVDDNTPHQGRLFDSIQRAIQSKYSQPTIAPATKPEPATGAEDIFPATALQTPTQSAPSWSDLGLEDEPKQGGLGAWRDKNKGRVSFQQLTDPRYQMRGKEVIPTDSNQMAALGQGLRHHRKRPPIDPEIEKIKAVLKVSSFDPSILSHDSHWKIYIEAKTYAYR